MPIKELTKRDQASKPEDFDGELIRLKHYYDDSSRTQTIRSLKMLGMGLEDNQYPIQTNYLRRIIDRRAVLYSKPPTRWLKDAAADQRVDESDDEHQNMLKVLKRSRYDMALKRMDRLRSLMRQMIVRFYPVDSMGSVAPRLFSPFVVKRCPSSNAPDILEEDECFALEIGNGGILEYWWKEDDGQWRMVHRKGDSVVFRPFAEYNDINPYAELPCHLVFDEFTAGEAWLPPRFSRAAWVMAINAVCNDLMSLSANEAHTETVHKTDDPTSGLKEMGPNVMHVVNRDDSVEKLASNPKIEGVLKVRESFIRDFSTGEDLPVSEFDSSKTILTGAALKVQQGPLLERREEQLPLAKDDELHMYRKLRAVHNLHAGSTDKWDIPELDEKYDISIDFSPASIPIEASELDETITRNLAVGFISMVDGLQMKAGIDREEAKMQLKRVREDDKDFPPRMNMVADRGPKMTKPTAADGDKLDGEFRNGRNSVVEGLRANTTPFGEPA